MPTYEELSDLPGWRFDVDEVSYGVYRAFGRNPDGRSVEKSGTEPKRLIKDCREAARQMIGIEHVSDLGAP